MSLSHLSRVQANLQVKVRRGAFRTDFDRLSDRELSATQGGGGGGRITQTGAQPSKESRGLCAVQMWMMCRRSNKPCFRIVTYV